MVDLMNPKEVAPAQLSATVLLVRDGDRGIEVLLTERPTTMSFAAGTVVFPGGKVDQADFEAAKRHISRHGHEVAFTHMACRIAGLRELAEETSLRFDVEARAQMQHFAHWITPVIMPKRFDTHFYLLPYYGEGEARLNSPDEITAIYWQTAEEALQAMRAGSTSMMFPTRLNLELIASQTTVADLVDFTAAREVVTVLPDVYQKGDEVWARIPEEAGYGVTDVPRDDIQVGHD